MHLAVTLSKSRWGLNLHSCTSCRNKKEKSELPHGLPMHESLMYSTIVHEKHTEAPREVEREASLLVPARMHDRTI
eukprot:593874-Amphidinium_carterae.1